MRPALHPETKKSRKHPPRSFTGEGITAVVVCQGENSRQRAFGSRSRKACRYGLSGGLRYYQPGIISSSPKYPTAKSTAQSPMRPFNQVPFLPGIIFLFPNSLLTSFNHRAL